MKNWFEVLGVISRVIWRRNFSRSQGDLAPRLGLLDIALMLVHSLTGANRLWLSKQLMDTVGFAEGLRFAEKHVHVLQRPGVSLLRANASGTDDQQWLFHVNQYLASFDTEPVALADRPGTRFERLCATFSSDVEAPELITVIMAAYNAEAFVEHAANSILSQTWKNLELIIVDDCSTDNTWTVIREIAARDPRVKTLRNAANVGPYVSKNLALRVARGKYITGQDADDWSHPERLQRDMAIIRASNGKIQAVVSMMLRMDEKSVFPVFSLRYPLPRNKDGLCKPALISLLIETDYLRHNFGGWDSVRFNADSELMARIRNTSSEAISQVAHIGFLCLDLASSLSNDPQHGISKNRGLSPVRKQYQRAFQKWHGRLHSKNAMLECPLKNRPFMIPAVLQVPVDAVISNIEAHEDQKQKWQTAQKD